MFACSRLVDRACTNDDNTIPAATLQEAVTLCQKDQSNIAKILKSLSSKLTNSFVQVRIKALTVMLHLSRCGPPAVLVDIRQYTPMISDTIQFRGEPHPVYGMQPYDQMRALAHELLELSCQSYNMPNQSQPIYGSFQQPTYQQPNAGYFNPPQQPPAPTSITTPYPAQTPPTQPTSITSPYPAQTPPTIPYGNTQYDQQTYNYILNQPPPTGPSIYGSVSNVPKSQPKTAKQNAENFLESVKNKIKTTFNTKRAGFGDFETEQIEQKQDQLQAQHAYGIATESNQEVYSYQPTSVGQIVIGTAGSLDDKDKMLTQATLIDPYARSQRSNSITHREVNQVKKKKTALSPAKKLLKVTGGRALANAQELTTFKQNITIESISELAEGLRSSEWKSAVRAILGLEVAGEVYGLPAVAKTKNEVFTLTGAPQQTLRTAAQRFYETIKEVQPKDPTVEQATAFNFGDSGSNIIQGEQLNPEEMEFSFAQAETRPHVMKQLEEGTKDENEEVEKNNEEEEKKETEPEPQPEPEVETNESEQKPEAAEEQPQEQEIVAETNNE